MHERQGFTLIAATSGVMKYRIFKRSRQAFSLVEMAVVLLIISIVAGGILVTDSLIQQAMIRAIISDYDHYLKSVLEFRDKYQALPGDMSTAEDLWDGPVNCGSHSITALPLGGTCNGDGNGLIGECADDLSAACGNAEEVFRVWQHLGYAGFIDGRYTGVQISASVPEALPGVNVPALKGRPGTWTLLHYTNASDITGLKGDTYGHVFFYGGHNGYTGIQGSGGAAAPFTIEPVLRTKDAQEIDRKIDDGRPRTGKIRAWENVWGHLQDGESMQTNCVNVANNDYGAHYNNYGTYVTADCTMASCLCSLIFILDF